MAKTKRIKKKRMFKKGGQSSNTDDDDSRPKLMNANQFEKLPIKNINDNVIKCAKKILNILNPVKIKQDNSELQTLASKVKETNINENDKRSYEKILSDYKKNKDFLEDFYKKTVSVMISNIRNISVEDTDYTKAGILLENYNDIITQSYYNDFQHTREKLREAILNTNNDSDTPPLSMKDITNGLNKLVKKRQQTLLESETCLKMIEENTQHLHAKAKKYGKVIPDIEEFINHSKIKTIPLVKNFIIKINELKKEYNKATNKLGSQNRNTLLRELNPINKQINKEMNELDKISREIFRINANFIYFFQSYEKTLLELSGNAVSNLANRRTNNSNGLPNGNSANKGPPPPDNGLNIQENIREGQSKRNTQRNTQRVYKNNSTIKSKISPNARTNGYAVLGLEEKPPLPPHPKFNFPNNTSNFTGITNAKPNIPNNVEQI